MKKFLSLIVLLLLFQNSQAQWNYEYKMNEFNEIINAAYVYDQDARTSFSIIKDSNRDFVIILTSLDYFCAESLSVDISLQIDNKNSVYTIQGTALSSFQSLYYRYTENGVIKYTYIKNLIRDLKRSSSMIVRIREPLCETRYYRFDMTDSAESINRLEKQIL